MCNLNPENTVCYYIDRFEGGFAVCEDADGFLHNLLRDSLPPEAAEGDVLRMNNDVLAVDPEATQRRREALRRKLESLWEE